MDIKSHLVTTSVMATIATVFAYFFLVPEEVALVSIVGVLAAVVYGFTYMIVCDYRAIARETRRDDH